ncbi:MAG: pyridoxal phosphate-dependent aminotransferase [Candidatus Wallbacteria bacterium]|nr:pyridoxal phosphate-dependent aminotransferase [Candidatus Wallbacteria bacterium]
MPLSKKISGICPSQTLAIDKKAKEMRASGKDVVALCAGEPDFPTPAPVKEAAIRAINANMTKYTVNAGIPELRSAIASKLKKENGLDYSPEEIVVSNGAKQAIYNGLRSLINTGDEVLLPAPCWVSYVEQIKLAGGLPVLVFGRSEKPSPSEIAARITPRTTTMIINSPNNPVGYVYTKSELTEIAGMVRDHNLMLISDEIYEKIIYGHEHFSPPALVPELRDRTLVINGFSKAFSMTGWRIGYAAGSKDMISLINRLQSHQTSNACSISQYAALEALTNPEVEKDISSMVSAFHKRRDYVCSRLAGIPGLSFYQPEGAFYVFIRIDSYFNNTIRNSLELCTWLLDEFLLALVPGSAFFKEEYIRLSYAASEEELTRGTDRLIQALERLVKS